MPRRLVVAGAAVLLVFAAIVGVKASSGDKTLAAARPLDPAGRIAAKLPPPATPYVDPRGGDLAPHEAENRAGRQPKDVTDEARQRLGAAAERIMPALESLRAKGKATPESVRQALVRLGYQADLVGVERREAEDQAWLVFGVFATDGCIEGAVRPDRVQVEVTGPTTEWGCLPPGPTH